MAERHPRRDDPLSILLGKALKFGVLPRERLERNDSAAEAELPKPQRELPLVRPDIEYLLYAVLPEQGNQDSPFVRGAQPATNLSQFLFQFFQVISPKVSHPTRVDCMLGCTLQPTVSEQDQSQGTVFSPFFWGPMRIRKRLAALWGGALVRERPQRISIIVDRSGATPQSPSQYLWAAAIIRDEGPYLREWIEFHRIVGVQHFVLYDNGSVDETPAVLAPYVSSGLVDLIPWPSFLSGANAQHLAYAHAARFASGRCRWLAVIDADEFLFSPQGESLPKTLSDYEDIPALGVFLRTFGASGHQRQPEGLVIENYVHRLPDTAWENQQYKSIVRPELVRSVISAQRFHNTLSNIPAHDENRRHLKFSIQHTHTSKRLRINHYATKSFEELERKIARRYFWSAANDEKRRMEKQRQHAVASVSDILDTDIHRFLPQLKARHGYLDTGPAVAAE